MEINEIYKKEFEESFENVCETSEQLNKEISIMTGKTITSEEWNNYLKNVKNLYDNNEKFKDAAFKYYGLRPNITGFE